MSELLLIENIEATAATQIRTKLHQDVINDYQQDMEDGAIFPPIDVFREAGSSRVILADGFHRLYGAVNAGKTEIDADIHEGGMHEALLFALSANRAHGLRRTNADKINAVKMALKDPAISQHSQGEIADLCGVSRATVNRVGVRDTVDPAAAGGNKSAPATPDDVRPTKPAPTQSEVELAEVQQALGLIKALPYDGEEAYDRLELTKDDIADMEYVATWASNVVIRCRNLPDPS